MKQPQDIAGGINGAEYDKEINLVSVLAALVKYKRLIIIVPLALGFIVGLFSLLLPNVYRATSKLLPPQQSQSAATALLSQFSGVAGMAAGVSGLKNPSDLYVGMLGSRTIADRVVSKLDLKKHYDLESAEKTRKKLEANTAIAAGKDGLITVEVDDFSPKMAANIANAYVAELMIMTKNLAVTEASQRRVFFGKQLEQAKDNLAKAEMSLQAALELTGLVNVDTQSRAIMETSGRLRAQVSAKEIELASMRSIVTDNNPRLKLVEAELSSLRNEMERLESGGSGTNSAPGKPANAQNAGKSIKFLRDVKYYEMLYELLAKQYEVANLDEAKDPSIIQILDVAIEPERKAKPDRVLIVLVAVVVGLIGTLAWIFMFVPALAARTATNGQPLNQPVPRRE